MKDKRKGINERKFLMEIKEFKKKNIIYDLTKKIEEKQKDIHKEINKVYDERLDKLRHNALTNNHLSQYIADLNFRLYSFPEKKNTIKGKELQLMQLYTEIVALLEKFQTIKSEKFLTDKKELEDRIMEQSLEEQKKELSYLSRQEKYEKYIYDKLLEAQNGLVDICQKYRTQVHLCETYEMNSLRLKSELDICKDTNKKLNKMAIRLRKIDKELRKKINEQEKENNIKIFEPIFSSKDNVNNKVIKLKENKTINVFENTFFKINIKRPKSSLRLNKNNTALILDKKNVGTNNELNTNNNNKFKLTKTNNFSKMGTIPINSRANILKFFPKNKNNFRRTFSRKISFREKSSKNRTISSHTTNYLTKTRNKSLNDIKQPITKNNEIVYDKNYLDAVAHFLTDNISQIREEIKLKVKYKAEEIRSRYQLRYMISKIIEDIESDLEIMKKEKAYDLNKYYDNLFGVSEHKEMRQLANILFDKKVESSGQQLYVLTYIFDNCFNGINNVKSIFPKEMLTYINVNE